MRRLVLSAALASVGCGGAGAGGIDQSRVVQPGAASECDRPSGQLLQLTSAEPLSRALQGTWQLCTREGLFHEPHDGLLIVGARYAMLELVAGRFALEPAGDFRSGKLEAKSATQVDFQSDAGSVTIAAPMISDDPRQLFINNLGVETFVYAAVRP